MGKHFFHEQENGLLVFLFELLYYLICSSSVLSSKITSLGIEPS